MQPSRRDLFRLGALAAAAVAFVAEANAADTCLEEVYGRTRSELGADENKIRGRETTLGNWIAAS